MASSVSLIDEVLPSHYTSKGKALEILSASYDPETKRLTVCWNGEGEPTRSEFPSIWLRDNCTCAECFSPSSQHRFVKFRETINLDPKLISVKNNVDSIRCEWASGHVGVFYSLWLWHRRFTDDMRQARWSSLEPLPRVPWCGPDFKPQRGTYHEVTETDQGFITFSEAMMRDGCFIVTGAPLEHCSQDWVNKTNILITKTTYGEIFEVNYRSDPTNIAYSSTPLDLHTDQNYILFNLKIQYLHFEKQTQLGGENILMDGLYAAQKLRNEYPSHYEVLTTTLIDNNDTLYQTKYSDEPNQKEHPHLLYARKPLIVTNSTTGAPDYIQFNNFPRSSFVTEPIERVEKWYEAMKVWLELIETCQISLKCQPGEILIFDNLRLMHGRLAFDEREPRMLEGWYSEWDWIHSGWRVAKHRQLQELHQSDKK